MCVTYQVGILALGITPFQNFCRHTKLQWTSDYSSNVRKREQDQQEDLQNTDCS
jgi:hypothetical protein